MGKQAKVLNKKREACYKEVNERYDVNVEDEYIEDEDENTNTINTLSKDIFESMTSHVNVCAYNLCEYLDADVIERYVQWVTTRL